MSMVGNLRSMGVASVLTSIAQDRRTGVLDVSGPAGFVQLHFRSGACVRAEDADTSAERLLLDMLLRLQAASAEGVRRAFAQWESQRGSFPELLVAARAIGHKDLDALVHLQTTETFFRIFGWNTGQYELREGEVTSSGVEPIDTESLLADGLRMADEWPVIRGRVGDDRQCYRKKNTIEDADENVIGPTEILVYTLVKEDRDVGRLEDLSRLGGFETRRALFQLLEAGYIGPVTLTGGHEEREEEARARTGLRYRAVHAGATLAILVAVVALLVLVARQRILSSTGAVLGTVSSQEGTVQARLGRNQVARLETAIEVYWLHRGKYPETLEAVVTEGLLSAGDMTFPFYEDPYFYRLRGERSYELIPPLR